MESLGHVPIDLLTYLRFRDGIPATDPDDAIFNFVKNATKGDFDRLVNNYKAHEARMNKKES